VSDNKFLPKVLLLLLFAASMCGPISEIEKAAIEVANANCNKHEVCQLADLFVSMVNPDACRVSVRRWSMDAQSAIGSSYSALQAVECARAINDQSCDSYFSGVWPLECRPKSGQLENGSACYWGYQCKSTFCAGKWLGCGKCHALVMDGDACNTVERACPTGMLCGDDEKCHKPANTGEFCSKSKPCGNGLFCLNSLCRRPRQLGDSCKRMSGASDCDGWHSIACNDTINQCVRGSFKTEGQACGWTSDGSEYRWCVGGASCNSGTNKCEKVRDEGSACDETAQKPCIFPLRCTDGKCTYTDSTMCM